MDEKNELEQIFINEIDKFIQDYEKEAEFDKNRNEIAYKYDRGVVGGLIIAKEIVEGKRRHG